MKSALDLDWDKYEHRTRLRTPLGVLGWPAHNLGLFHIHNGMDESYADALVDPATKEFGGREGAFNNAGIVSEMQPVPAIAIGSWIDMISVNLMGAFLTAKAQIPAMKTRGQGSIVFTSSFVGFSNGGVPRYGSLCRIECGIDRLGEVASIEPCRRGHTRQCAIGGRHNHAKQR